MKNNIEYSGADDPDFPRRYVHDHREYEWNSNDGHSSPTMKFLFKKWTDLKEEFPFLDPSKVRVESYGNTGDSYDGSSVYFSFDRLQTDQEYAKALYYNKQSEARKAKRAAEKALTAEQKISAKEAKERAEFERLKRKFENG